MLSNLYCNMYGYPALRVIRMENRVNTHEMAVNGQSQRSTDVAVLCDHFHSYCCTYTMSSNTAHFNVLIYGLICR